jgi:hypothetical protein
MQLDGNTTPTLRVETVRSLLNELEGFINQSEFLPATRLFKGAVILALLSKAITVARAVCVLDESDFPGEAFGLCRTLIDIFFTVRYIGNKDSEERARRFWRFYAKDRVEWTRIIPKYIPNAVIPSNAMDSNLIQIAGEYDSQIYWTDLPGQTRAMAMEPDTYEMDEAGNPRTCAFDYQMPYKHTSFFVHATVSCLDGHVSEIGDRFRVRSGMKFENARGRDALFNTLAYIHRSFATGFRCLGYDPPTAILAKIAKEMKTTTRTAIRESL